MIDPRGQHSARDHLLLRLTRATRVRGGRPRFYFGYIIHRKPNKNNLCMDVKHVKVRSFVLVKFNLHVYIYSLAS